MRHRKFVIATTIVLTAFIIIVFVPATPIVMHETPIGIGGNTTTAKCFIGLNDSSSVYPCPNSYSYYGSMSYYVSGVGFTYLPNSTFPPTSIGYRWSPDLPRS